MARPAGRRLAPLVAVLIGAGLLPGCSADHGTNPPDPRFTGIVVQPDSMLINVGLQGHLEVWMVDTAGELVFPPSKVTYRSRNPSLAFVDSSGFVQAGNDTGVTTIRVASGGYAIEHRVRVAYLPLQMTVTPTSVLLPAHGSLRLTVRVLDLSGRLMTDPPVTFTPSDPAIISASDGLVTSVGPAGMGSVTVRVGDLVQQIPVMVGDFPTFRLVHTTGMSNAMYRAAVGAGGKVVVTARDGGMVARGTLPSFDLPTSIPTGATPLGLAVNHAGTRAYVATADRLSLIDLDSNVALTPILLPGGGNKASVVLSQDETRAYVGTATTVYVVDLAGGSLVDSVATGPAGHIALHPSQPRLYVSQYPVREVDLTTMQLTTRQFGTTPADPPADLAVSPDGTQLLVLGGDSLRVFDLASTTQVQVVPVPISNSYATGLAVGSNLIVVTAGVYVHVFDEKTRFPLSTVTVGANANFPAISPDGRTIVVPNDLGYVSFLQ